MTNARYRRFATTLLWHFALCILHCAPAGAQELVDRVAARVDGFTITRTDVLAAMGLGVVEAKTEDEAVQRMIDRQLLLAEVARFPPAEPPAAFIDAQVTRERTAAGGRLPQIMQATGLDEQRIREMARDTLRIQSYIDERFGTSLQATDDEAEAYYNGHPNEFRRNGVLIPLEEALQTARERANAERRRASVERWLQDLRARAEIEIPKPPAAS